jgi:hypothetical protein
MQTWMLVVVVLGVLIMDYRLAKLTQEIRNRDRHP